MNGQDYTADGVQYEYYLTPRVHAIYPGVGSSDGYTALNITGENFYTDSEKTLCRFDGESTLATVINSTFIQYPVVNGKTL